MMFTRRVLVSTSILMPGAWITAWVNAQELVAPVNAPVDSWAAMQRLWPEYPPEENPLLELGLPEVSKPGAISAHLLADKLPNVQLMALFAKPAAVQWPDKFSGTESPVAVFRLKPRTQADFEFPVVLERNTRFLMAVVSGNRLWKTEAEVKLASAKPKTYP